MTTSAALRRATRRAARYLGRAAVAPPAAPVTPAPPTALAETIRWAALCEDEAARWWAADEARRASLVEADAAALRAASAALHAAAVRSQGEDDWTAARALTAAARAVWRVCVPSAPTRYPAPESPAGWARASGYEAARLWAAWVVAVRDYLRDGRSSVPVWLDRRTVATAWPCPPADGVQVVRVANFGADSSYRGRPEMSWHWAPGSLRPRDAERAYIDRAYWAAHLTRRAAEAVTLVPAADRDDAPGVVLRASWHGPAGADRRGGEDVLRLDVAGRRDRPRWRAIARTPRAWAEGRLPAGALPLVTALAPGAYWRDDVVLWVVPSEPLTLARRRAIEREADDRETREAIAHEYDAGRGLVREDARTPWPGDGTRRIEL